MLFVLLRMIFYERSRFVGQTHGKILSIRSLFEFRITIRGEISAWIRPSSLMSSNIDVMNNGINTLVFKTEKTSTTLNLSLLTEGYDADAKVKLHQCGSTVRLSVNGRGRRDLLIGR